MHSSKKQVRGSNPRGRSAGSTPVAANSMSKFWCFTINNPVNDFAEVDGVVKWDYMIVGNEIGPEDGVPHLQGFVCYHSRTRFSTVKNQMPRAHIEAMSEFSTPIKAAEYCKKDGVYFEAGVIPDFKGGKTGGQTKVENFKKAIEYSKAGDFTRMEEELPHMYWNSYSTMKRIAMDHPPKVDNLDGVCGEWIWGPPGTGKSHTARVENPSFYDKVCNKGWEGYQNQEVAIMDDFDKVHHVLGHYLKRWGDKYPFQADIKYSNTYIRPKKLVITSNYKIEDVFWEDLTLQEAILRRFKVRLMDKVYVAPVVTSDLEDSEESHEVWEIDSE